MAGPTIEFRTFLDELRAMRQLANSGGFLTSASYDRLDRFEEDVRCVRSQGDTQKALPIEIAKRCPIETRASTVYRPGGKQGRPVAGNLAVVWLIRPVGQKRRGKYGEFVVDTDAGPASTRVSICTAADEYGESEELAAWHSDIRTSHGPGCFYHLQVLGETDETLFPDFLGIPRFPDPFTSPMAVLEFLLCELFPQGNGGQRKRSDGGCAWMNKGRP